MPTLIRAALSQAAVAGLALAGCSSKAPEESRPTTKSVPVVSAPAVQPPEGSASIAPVAERPPPVEGFVVSERAYAFTAFHGAALTHAQVEAALKPLLSEGWAVLRDTLPDEPPRPAVLIELQRGEAVSPPDVDTLRVHNRGLSEAAMQATSAATGAVVVSWLTGSDAEGEALRLAHRAMAELAERVSATALWDETTLEAFSIEAWRGLRLGGEHPGVEARRYITLRMVADPTSKAPGHLVTSGMSRFGLPDLTLPEVSPAEAHAVGPLLDVVAQALLEGARPDPQGGLLITREQIKHPNARARLIEPRGAASGAGPLRLAVAPAQPGDPKNRLIQVMVPRKEGETPHAARVRWLTEALGAPEKAQP